MFRNIRQKVYKAIDYPQQMGLCTGIFVSRTVTQSSSYVNYVSIQIDKVEGLMSKFTDLLKDQITTPSLFGLNFGGFVW